MNNQSTSLVRGSALALAMLALAGCSSMPFQSGSTREAAYGSVNKAAGDVAEISGRIDGTIRTLDDLVNHPAADMKAQYRAYTKALDDLQDATEDLSKRSMELQTVGQNYFIAWDREIASIRDEDLRNRSADRKTEVTRGFDNLRDRYVEAREALVPLVRTLNEAKTALAIDLTSRGVSTVEPTLSQVNDQADPAREALRRLGEELRVTGVALSAEVAPGRENRRS